MRETFRSFNALRLLAALAIIGYHYFRLTSLFNHIPGVLQNIVSAGPIALPFFYILSGFVLTHAYIDRPPNDGMKRRSFWVARAARLYPVYLLAFVLFLPIAYEKYLHAHTWEGVKLFAVSGLLNLAVLQAWTPLSQSWNGPSWSLSVEAFFYFLFPFIVRSCLHIRLWLAVASTGAMLLGMTVLCGLSEHGHLAPYLWSGWIRNSPLYWLPVFVLGIISYRMLPLWRTLNANVTGLIGCGAIAALVLLCGTSSSHMLDILINGGSAPLLAIVILCFATPVCLRDAVLSTRSLYLLGGASYITYILQAPVWHIVDFLLRRDRVVSLSAGVPAWQFVVYSGILLSLSLLVQARFERPAQQWLLALACKPRFTPSVQK